MLIIVLINLCVLLTDATRHVDMSTAEDLVDLYYSKF